MYNTVLDKKNCLNEVFRFQFTHLSTFPGAIHHREWGDSSFTAHEFISWCGTSWSYVVQCLYMIVSQWSPNSLLVNTQQELYSLALSSCSSSSFVKHVPGTLFSMLFTPTVFSVQCTVFALVLVVGTVRKQPQGDTFPSWPSPQELCSRITGWYTDYFVMYSYCTRERERGRGGGELHAAHPGDR